MVRIALDAMGGDHAPQVTVKGALDAIDSFPNITITLLGPIKTIQKQLKKHGVTSHDRIELVDAPDVIEMCESPTVAYRKKKESSVHKGLELVKEGKVDGFVSAGNTGAVMTASTFILGRIPNVERPAIATVLPTKIGKVVMLDMGSTVDCKAEHLAQFATMGHYFSKLVMGVDNPKVGLLNIGEEEEKGNSATQAAYKLIQDLPLQFIGNIEGKVVLTGQADVIVCDGFVGNSLLKFGEGVSSLFRNFFKEEAKSSIRSLIGMLILKPAFKRFKKKYDYNEYGGAPLLGVNGVSIIAHGTSNEKAIKNAIKTAIDAHEGQMVSSIEGAIA